jgi:hypothetical protein
MSQFAILSFIFIGISRQFLVWGPTVPRVWGSQVYAESRSARSRDHAGYQWSTPAVYAIERHDRLYLDVRGEGRAAWRIRCRPKPNAHQRWFTLSEDARNASFDDVARKARDLLTNLRLHGVDPHVE